METVRLGIIGYGNIGITHAKNVMSGKVPGMTLTAVCDIAEARREMFKKTYPGIETFEDHESLYKSGLAMLLSSPFPITIMYRLP